MHLVAVPELGRVETKRGMRHRRAALPCHVPEFGHGEALRLDHLAVQRRNA